MAIDSITAFSCKYFGVRMGSKIKDAILIIQTMIFTSWSRRLDKSWYDRTRPFWSHCDATKLRTCPSHVHNTYCRDCTSSNCLIVYTRPLQRDLTAQQCEHTGSAASVHLGQDSMSRVRFPKQKSSLVRDYQHLGEICQSQDLDKLILKKEATRT